MAERRTSNRACVDCERQRVAAWRRANPAYRRYWVQRHTDTIAAQTGVDNARQRAQNCVPADFDLYETVAIYREARLKTARTGVAHEVDHVVALILGGLHTPGNLQVLTAKQNRAKAVTEQAARRQWLSGVVSQNMPEAT
jgi:5-methylcytosine-specific restriction endonuclease McrA